MKASGIAWCVCVIVAMAGAAVAADSRSYSRSIEPVWDEAVKAVRDANLELVDSSRAEHWFTMQTKKKTLSKSVGFEVRLTNAGDQTTVTVREIDSPGTKKSAKAIAAFLDSLDRRLR